MYDLSRRWAKEASPNLNHWIFITLSSEFLTPPPSPSHNLRRGGASRRPCLRRRPATLPPPPPPPTFYACHYSLLRSEHREAPSALENRRLRCHPPRRAPGVRRNDAPGSGLPRVVARRVPGAGRSSQGPLPICGQGQAAWGSWPPRLRVRPARVQREWQALAGRSGDTREGYHAWSWERQDRRQPSD